MAGTDGFIGVGMIGLPMAVLVIQSECKMVAWPINRKNLQARGTRADTASSSREGWRNEPM
jgi:hypothetical protein